VYGGPGGEDDEGEGDGHADHEPELQEICKPGGGEACEYVATEVCCTEGNIAEESYSNIDGGAKVDGTFHYPDHFLGAWVRQAGVHLEYVGLAGEGHGDDGEALEHPGRSPQVHQLEPFIC